MDNQSLFPGADDGWSSWIWEKPLGQDSHEAVSRQTVQAVGYRGAARMYDCKNKRWIFALVFFFISYAQKSCNNDVQFLAKSDSKMYGVCVEWWAEGAPAAAGLSVSH